MPEENHAQPFDPAPEDAQGARPHEGAQDSPVNRPADGARLATPGEVLDDAFQGSANAGDFLGLDTEFTGASVMRDPSLGLDVSPAPSVPAGSGAPPSMRDVGHIEPEFEAEDAYLASDEGDEYLDAFEEDHELAEAYAQEFGDGSGGGSRKPLVVGAFVVGLGIVAAVTLGPRFLGDGFLGDGGAGGLAGSRVATVPTTSVAPTDLPHPALDPALGGTDTTPVEGTELAVEDGGAEVPEGGAVATEPLVEPGTDTEAAPELATTDPDPESFLPAELFGAAGEPVAEGGEEDPGGAFQGDLLSILTEGDDGEQGVQNASAFPDFTQNFEWVTDDKLDMIWRGETIPMEAIAAPARTLMPRVGHVRAYLVGGESLDGRLYALGQDRVWLKMERGLFGLDGSLVERIEAVDTGAKSLAGSGSGVTNVQPAGGRVRIQLPGGPIYGRIHSRNGDMVTVVTDAGGKVTLKSPEIQELGSKRAIVVEN